MSKRYSGKSFKDSSVMKKAKLSLKEKRKLKKEKNKKKIWCNIGYLNQHLWYIVKTLPTPTNLYLIFTIKNVD